MGGGRLDWRWAYGWNWSSGKVPSRDQGGEIANLDRGIKEVKSGSGGTDLGIGIRAGCWQSEPENRTKPSLFLFHPVLVKHIEDCIRKTQDQVDEPKRCSKYMKNIYPEHKKDWCNIMKNFWRSILKRQFVQSPNKPYSALSIYVLSSKQIFGQL